MTQSVILKISNVSGIWLKYRPHPRPTELGYEFDKIPRWSLLTLKIVFIAMHCPKWWAFSEFDKSLINGINKSKNTVLMGEWWLEHRLMKVGQNLKVYLTLTRGERVNMGTPKKSFMRIIRGSPGYAIPATSPLFLLWLIHLMHLLAILWLSFQLFFRKKWPLSWVREI